MLGEAKTLKEIEEEIAVSIARNASVTGAAGGYGTFSVRDSGEWGTRHIALALVGVGAALFLLKLVLWW